jgi:hypothetical protein
MPVAPGTTEFHLDRAITVAGSADHVTLDGSVMSAGVLLGIEQDDAFPDGDVPLGDIEFGVGTQQDIEFDAGAARVSFGGSVHASLAAAICASPAAAIAALRLPDTPTLDLGLPARQGDRFFLIRAGYAADLRASATHPLGVLGGATFGVTDQQARAFAIVHRFGAAESRTAKSVIADTIGSWRLPRHVGLDAAGNLNLKPGTWLVAEANGSLAIALAATLGYDVSFMRRAMLAGVTKDLGVTLDAALKATLGFSVAGRYVLVVGNEGLAAGDARPVRLRLFKTSNKGLSIGLNLDVGVKASAPLPDKLNDLVKAVFGQHGLQVLKDIEKWADPQTPLANNVAQLANDTGLDLLKNVAGIHAEAEFDKGRAIVLAALTQWDELPGRVSALMWDLLQQEAGTAAGGKLKTFLDALANPDPDTRAKALAAALANELFADSPIAQWLQAAAERGISALSLDEASRIASATLDVLNGGILKRLHDYIDGKLDLDAVRRGDFASVDKWLIARLADFLNKTALGAAELKEIQTAITALDAKVHDLYEKGIQAATKRYNLDVAATYAKTTTGTALLDATFDLAIPAARGVFAAVIDGNLDALLTASAAGVSIGAAVLSHEMQRKSSISVLLPFGTFNTTHVNDSIANLTVEEHGGRVLVYDIKATDTVTASRYLSELSLLAKLRSVGGRLALDDDDTSLAYETLQARPAMQLTDLEKRTDPFIRTYFPAMFGRGDAGLGAFYGDLDVAAGGSTHQLGDTALSMTVSYPSSVLAAWFQPRTAAEIEAGIAKMSCRLQAAIRPLLASAFFQDLDNFGDNALTAALLVWASLPVASAVDFDGHTIRALFTDRGDFWDFENPRLTGAMAGHALTIAKLGGALEDAHARLVAAGASNADDFRAATAPHYVSLALGGDLRLHGLLFMEAEIVKGLGDALSSVSDAVAADRDASPTAAIEKFTDFAGALTATFNANFKAPYGVDALQALGPAVLAETSAALASTSPVDARAMLRMYFFKAGHAFSLDRFVANELPPSSDVRLAQTLATY